MPRCWKCGKDIISFNDHHFVYIQGKGKTSWCDGCYDREMNKFNVAMTPKGKEWIVREDVMDQ